MTAPSGNIVFNSGSGSDTLASGLGPATAVNNSTESTTASYSTTTITFSGATDLSGVSAGDCLYLATSTGRKLFIIATVNDGADQVTIDDTPTGTASGLNWAIGGKRASLGADSKVMFGSDGAKPGWVLELESGYTETFSSSTTISVDGNTTDGFITIKASDGAATTPILTMSGTGTMFSFSADRWELMGLDFENTNASPGVCLSSSDHGAGYGYRIENCGWRNSTNEFSSAVSSAGDGKWRLVFCEIAHCSGNGVYVNDANASIDAFGCFIHDNGGHGVASANGNIVIDSCVIHNNTTDGVNGASNVCVTNSVIDDNGSDGIACDELGHCYNNVITDNGAYGINNTGSDVTIKSSLIDYNAFRGNTSGEMTGDVPNNANNVTLTADPYTDKANDDFTLNATAGGGAACADAGFPQSIPGV